MRGGQGQAFIFQLQDAEELCQTKNNKISAMPCLPDRHWRNICLKICRDTACRISMMQRGDCALFYHSRSGKNVFGIMQVARLPYQDPTTNTANWLAIDFEPIKTLESPISLRQIKTEPTLQNIGLIKQPRLSVIRLSKNEFEKIINLLPEMKREGLISNKGNDNLPCWVRNV